MARRLAAILIADVVDYSRLMGEDEVRTLAALAELRQKLFEPVVSARGGKVVKRMGDGWIVEFPNISDATASAVAVQEGLADHEVIKLRIGVHIGDVTFQGDDVYGDGINVAARLEAMAEPGQVLISDTAHHSLDGKAAAKFGGGKQHDLKNIARPIAVWNWPIGSETTVVEQVALAIPDKPSIAVLPFDNMSGDPEQAYFADGIAEDVITALSRFRSLFVIARNSSFSYRGQSPDIRVVARELGVRYVVEGSVRKAGQRVRITAQLIEAETGNHLWAERFDRELEDIFAVQDEITQRIVGALQPEIGTAEWERARRRLPDSLDAWALYHQGIHHLYQYSKADNAEARRLFRQAIERDNQFAAAHAMLAYACFMAVFDALTEYRVDQLAESFETAQQAVRLDDQDAMAHAILGRVLSMRHQHGQAIAECDKAIDLNANLAQAQFGRGLALVLSGQPGEAIANLENAEKLSPRDPNYYAFLIIRAWANLLQGQYDVALELTKRAIAQPNSGVWGNATLAIVLAHLDQCEEARKALDALIEDHPDFALSFIEETLPFRREADRHVFEDGLRRSGLTA